MSSIGPDLPPHLLAKRKRQAEEDEASVKPTVKVPSPEPEEKKRRVVGPAAPRAPLDELSPTDAQADATSNSSDDDDFGPAPPPVGGFQVC